MSDDSSYTVETMETEETEETEEILETLEDDTIQQELDQMAEQVEAWYQQYEEAMAKMVALEQRIQQKGTIHVISRSGSEPFHAVLDQLEADATNADALVHHRFGPSLLAILETSTLQ